MFKWSRAGKRTARNGQSIHKSFINHLKITLPIQILKPGNYTTCDITGYNNNQYLQQYLNT